MRISYWSSDVCSSDLASRPTWFHALTQKRPKSAATTGLPSPRFLPITPPPNLGRSHQGRERADGNKSDGSIGEQVSAPARGKEQTRMNPARMANTCGHLAGFNGFITSCKVVTDRSAKP